MNGPKILVTGQTGQVTQALAYVAARQKDNVFCAGRPSFDLMHPGSIRETLQRYKPDVVINTAAFTSVDSAEDNEGAAFALNRDGVRALWDACRDQGARLLHLSTDCVFDGQLDRAYRPDDSTAPLSVYGASKLAGEQVLTGQPAVIVRVSWIFSRFGSNFVTTMLRLATTRGTVRVVDDQVGCPTHAEDLAAGLISMAGTISTPGFNAWGTYHLTGQGETDRASQAETIFAASRKAGGPFAEVKGVPTSDYRTPAKRPFNARLDCTSTREVFDVRLPHWEKRLIDAVHETLEDGRGS